MQAEMVGAVSWLRELGDRTKEVAAERDKHLGERFADFERAQIGLAESLAAGSQRLDSLDLAQDRLASNQREQAKRLEEMVASLDALQRAQDAMAEVQAQHRGHLQEAIGGLNEIRRISLMGWWQRREARRANKSKP
jgi:chromosome segregation ATPase